MNDVFDIEIKIDGKESADPRNPRPQDQRSSGEHKVPSGKLT